MNPETIKIEQTINAPIEKVWQAITDKNQMKQWYFDIPEFELIVGAIADFYEPGIAKKYHHRLQIEEVIPNRKLKHSWLHPEHSKGVSHLTWELETLDQNTKLTLTHEGTGNFKDAGAGFETESYKAGWKEIIGKSLKNFLETKY